MAAADFNLELFVSLLFVVVIEIGGIARSLDLERISEEKLPPFFIGLFYLLDTGSSQQKVSVPQLGRFNFLHGANLAILLLGFILVSTTSSGLTKILVSLVTFIIWALIPLLEIDEYEEILIDGLRPVSYYHHVVIVSISAVLISFRELLWSLFPYQLHSLIKQSIQILVILCLYYTMLFGFLKHLERELDREDTDQLPNKLTQTDPTTNEYNDRSEKTDQ